MEDRLRVRVALGGFTFFVLALLALHVFNMSAVPRHMSSFVFGRDSWLWPLALISLAVGIGCLATALRARFAETRDVLLATSLLWIAAILLCALVLFPTDPAPWPFTFTGYVHVLAAIASITLQAAAMLLLVDAGRADPHLGTITGTSFAWPAWAAGLGFLWGFSDAFEWAISPLVQRALALLMVTWLALVTIRLDALVSDTAEKGTPDSVSASR